MKVMSFLCFVFLVNMSIIAQKPITKSKSSGGFSIQGKILGLQNTDVYLAHYFGSNQQVIKDTANVDALGNFIFKGTEDLPKGLYLISYDKSKYLDIILGNTSFSFETDTLDMVGRMKVKGSPENEAFFGFQQEMSRLYGNLRNEQANSPGFLASRKNIQDYQKNWMQKNSNLFVSKLIKATFEPEIPAYPKLPKNAKDSADLYQYQFRYFKNHFFDNIDFNDERFVRTPFLQKKLEKFFEDLVVQESDSIAFEADKIIKKIKNLEVRKYVVYKISSTYENHNIVGTDGAFVHLAEKYYINEPSLWDTSTVRRMKERIKIIKPLLIGKRIPEMYLTDPNGKLLTLANIPAAYTVVFIYDPECTHCREETPKIVAQADYFKSKNVAVLATSIIRDKESWKKFIEEFKIQNWYNGIDIHINAKTSKEEFYTDYKNTYDVYSTPVIYILDKSKRIIGKRIPADKIQDFIEFAEKKNKNIK